MAQIPYSPRQLEMIHEACRMVAECHVLVRGMCVPGQTTRKIDQAVGEYLLGHNATSPFYHYQLPGKVPFPATICTSLNDVVVHGVPDEQPLVEGDLISIDIGIRKNGYIGDSAWTYPVGRVDEEAERLLRIGEESLYAGIRAMRPRGILAEASRAIQQHIEKHGFSVVREYVGHGVGRALHEEPQIPNYVHKEDFHPARAKVLRPGMCLAIEPMVNAGGPKVISSDTGWPVRTADGSRSVHFEHTVAVLDDRIEILTLKPWDPPV
jgi:methionyl aminopeptidase